ncbi:hypothetical protein JIR23_27780 [Bradyrhizobium diazoefficiens]|nr:HTH domain-containing protein [Bradyrhizobium diazoefficiens]QQN63285.1 hypothetical protein JIR23_27780 [Bradyrhizobium diazoefficiens]
MGMEKLTFVELGKKILREAKRPLAPSEVWKIAVAQGDAKRLETTGKTPSQTLYSAIYLDQRDNPNTEFVKYNTSPVRYFLKSLIKDQQPLELQEKAASEPVVPQIHNFLEKDLHSFLSYFAYRRFEANSRTIKHQGSTKKEFGEWVHPDMIAVRYPTWHSDIGDLSSKFGETGLKFYSFELKKELTFSNLRESFFQAVSNSSWAHEGYLVASEVSGDGEFREELRRLSSSFGIGVIEIDVEDPDSSEIVFPARWREVVDWDTLNKLVNMNPDAKVMVDQINKAMQIKDYRYGLFDSTERPKPLVPVPISTPP